MSFIVLAAGGTAGHLFPAAALAGELSVRGHRTHLLTDARGLSYTQGLKDLPKTLIASGSIVGKSLLTKLRSGHALVSGIWQARHVLVKLKPEVLVGFGGYPSFPPLVAAWTLGIPTLLHEQNAVMGLANRHMSRFAKAIALSFDPTKKQVRPKKAVHIGNPVRAEISAVPDLNTCNDELNLLVFAGSQGARVMADLVPEAVAGLSKGLRQRLNVTLQLRAEDQGQARQTLAGSQLKCLEITDFLDPIAPYLAKADLVICRSGATSVCEMAAAGRPALFIPLEIHADTQQARNAEALVAAGGALLEKQSSLTAACLRARLEALLSAPGTLIAMAQAARTLATPKAAADLADLTLRLRKTS